MLAEKQIALIGGGHIAGIIIDNLTQRNVIPPDKILVSDPDRSRCRFLSNHYDIRIASDNLSAARKGDVILICVRPEVVRAVIPDLRAADLRKDQVIISIAAGVTLSAYQSLGDTQPLVRALPNPPSQVGQGIAPLVFNPACSQKNRETVFELFSALGDWVEVDETHINAITSLSSPVTTYLFLQALIAAGVECGLPEPVAARVASRTITGSVEVWKYRHEQPAELVREASTPGGVSVECIRVLNERGFNQAIVEAIRKGAARSEELGQPPA